MEFEQRRAYIASRFYETFGAWPEIWVQAPGRVDLMGSHTDYNEGFVLTEAIDRDTWIAARPASDRHVHIASLNSGSPGSFDLDDIQPDIRSPWTNYVRGVADILQKEDYPLSGFDGLVHSTVPFGSGLSSSAALEVACAVLFDHLGNLEIDPVDLAKMCQRAENEFVGMSCGILDQYSSLMGRSGQVLLLDCRQITSQTKPIAGDLQVVICDTRAERALTGSEYPERRAQCESGTRILANYDPQIKTLRDASLELLDAHTAAIPEVIANRSRFIIQENQRVLDLANALADADYDRIKNLACESFDGARNLYEISCPEMDQMFAAMISSPGVIGARQAGAGFGGCMVAFVHRPSVEDFSQRVRELYLAGTGIKPDVFHVIASDGAGILPF
jgi:galactokinase